MKRLQELMAAGDGLNEGANELPIDLNLEGFQGGNEGSAEDQMVSPSPTFEAQDPCSISTDVLQALVLVPVHIKYSISSIVQPATI